MKAIVTPLTVALEEGKLTHDELRDFMTRSNWAGFRHLALFVITNLLTGSLVFLAYENWLIWPAMFVHGLVVVHFFSLEHECIHSTAFRTRWMNKVVGHIAGFLTLLPYKFFRYEHCDHHTYTHIDGKDPEHIEMPTSYWGYLWFLSGIPYWWLMLRDLINHSLGRLNRTERRFLPKVEHDAVKNEARVYLFFYLLILLFMFAFDFWAPVWFWFIPLVLAEPVMRFIRMTEHVGRPVGAQRVENTRTNIVGWPWQFLCWNMNFHAEHHYVASVPFHALPRLHEKLKDHIYIEKGGYVGAHKDILSQLSENLKNAEEAKAS